MGSIPVGATKKGYSYCVAFYISFVSINEKILCSLGVRPMELLQRQKMCEVKVYDNKLTYF